MDQEELKKSLQQLREELQQAEGEEVPNRALLAGLRDDIERVLDEQDEESRPEDPSFLERLEDAFAELEVTHPRVTITLNHVINMLSNMGI